MNKVVFLICYIFLCSVLSWGQTWKLSPTMTATLNNTGVLTITTTANAEDMPDFTVTLSSSGTYFSTSPWSKASILSVIIEEKITTIGAYSFYGCAYLKSIEIPNSVTTIGNMAFHSCMSLVSVTIPNSVTTIGAGAFGWCSALTSVTIPNSVTTIDSWAFDGCSAFASVTIPSSVTTIGTMAFSRCSSLIVVFVEWATPLSINESYSIFEEEKTSAVILFVPTGTKALYQATAVWKDFRMIVEYDPTHIERIEIPILNAYTSNGVLTISGLQAGKPISIYSISGQLVFRGVAKTETEQIPLNVRGIYIVTAENQTIKTIVE